MAERILIDGRSGSGKTELAVQLLRSITGAQLVRLDDLYPGWGGLEAGSRHVHDNVLKASVPRWQRWDWGKDAPAEWHQLDPSLPIIIEGCGSLSLANRQSANYAIWVELDTATRKVRALARDGDSYALHWDAWAAQEDEFIRRERPRQLADQIIEG